MINQNFAVEFKVSEVKKLQLYDFRNVGCHKTYIASIHFDANTFRRIFQ